MPDALLSVGDTMLSTFFKWLSVATLVVTTIALHNGLLPPYAKFTDIDTGLWILGLGSIAMLQIILLLCKVPHCHKCRLWSDFLLQLTGLALVMFAGVFGVLYPPFTWAMGVFPILGLSYIVAGRLFSQHTRYCLRSKHATTRPTHSCRTPKH